MHLLAIDPAIVRMGLARWRSPGDFWSGVETLDGETIAKRLHCGRTLLRRKLVAFAERGEAVDAIYIEDFDAQAWSRGGNSNAHTLAALTKVQGMVEELGEELRLPVHLVAVSTWRKHFLGFGRAGKGQKVDWKKLAIQRCRQLGHNPKDHNEAEAIAVLDYARCLHDPRFGAASTELSRRGAAA